MKLNPLDWLRCDDRETLAVFGEAKLVKHLNGRLELVGGTAADQTAAREWTSLFLHEAVFSRGPFNIRESKCSSPTNV